MRKLLHFVQLKYSVKANLNASPGEYTNWICPTSPAFSWFKNVRVELDGTEVTQSSKVSDMQIVQHIMSLMECSIGKLQYSDSDLFGLQKLDPRKSLKRIPLANYEYGAMARNASHFAANWPTSRSNEFRQKNPKKKWRRPTHVFLHLNLKLKSLVRQAHERSSKLMSFRFRFFF